jgi:membrane-bound lytic murein transglycosylase D
LQNTEVILASNTSELPQSSNPPATANGTTPKLVTEQEVVEDDIEDVVINKKPKKSTYVVKKKDNLIAIADNFGVDVYDLKVWNHLTKTTIQPGQKLVIYKETAVTSQVKYARNNHREKESVRKGKTRFHNVQDGDTLWNISQRYGGVSIDKLKKLNGIKGNVVKAGMKIRVS